MANASGPTAVCFSRPAFEGDDSSSPEHAGWVHKRCDAEALEKYQSLERRQHRNQRASWTKTSVTVAEMRLLDAERTGKEKFVGMELSCDEAANESKSWSKWKEWYSAFVAAQGSGKREWWWL